MKEIYKEMYKETYSLEQVKEIIKNHWLLDNGFEETDFHSVEVTDSLEVYFSFKSKVAE